MRAERIDIKKRDAGQHSDDAPVITYDCEDCGNQDPPD